MSVRSSGVLSGAWFGVPLWCVWVILKRTMVGRLLPLGAVVAAIFGVTALGVVRGLRISRLFGVRSGH